MLPSHSSIVTYSIRRKKLFQEIHHNTEIVLKSLPVDGKLATTSIVVVNRQVFINNKEIALSWIKTYESNQEFINHFKSTLNSALISEGFDLLHEMGGISIYKYSGILPEKIII